MITSDIGMSLVAEMIFSSAKRFASTLRECRLRKCVEAAVTSYVSCLIMHTVILVLPNVSEGGRCNMEHSIKMYARVTFYYAKNQVVAILKFITSLAKLTMARIGHGECFVMEFGFCCDTGQFQRESRHTNPWAAVRWLHYLNSEEAHRYNDGPGGGYVGDGTMWHDDYEYSQAPYGW